MILGDKDKNVDMPGMPSSPSYLKELKIAQNRKKTESHENLAAKQVAGEHIREVGQGTQAHDGRAIAAGKTQPSSPSGKALPPSGRGIPIPLTSSPSNASLPPSPIRSDSPTRPIRPRSVAFSEAPQLPQSTPETEAPPLQPPPEPPPPIRSDSPTTEPPPLPLTPPPTSEPTKPPIPPQRAGDPARSPARNIHEAINRLNNIIGNYFETFKNLKNFNQEDLNKYMRSLIQSLTKNLGNLISFVKNVDKNINNHDTQKIIKIIDDLKMIHFTLVEVPGSPSYKQEQEDCQKSLSELQKLIK